MTTAARDLSNQILTKQFEEFSWILECFFFSKGLFGYPVGDGVGIAGWNVSVFIRASFDTGSTAKASKDPLTERIIEQEQTKFKADFEPTTSRSWDYEVCALPLCYSLCLDWIAGNSWNVSDDSSSKWLYLSSIGLLPEANFNKDILIFLLISN